MDFSSFFKALLDHCPAVIYAKDLEGKYLYTNSQFEEIFGLKREDILGRPDFDLFPREQAEGFRNNDLIVSRLKQSTVFDEEVPQLDGLHYYVSAKFPIFDEKGRIYATGGVSNDVSENTRLKTGLEDHKFRLDVAMEAVGFAVWDLNLVAKTLSVDPRASEILGIKEFSFGSLAASLGKITFPEDQPLLHQEIEDSLKNQKGIKLELRIRAESHEARFVRMESKGFYGAGGEPLRFIGVVWDVTDEVERDKKMLHTSKMSSLGEMSAGLAHEINNPLAIIMGKTQHLGMLAEANKLDLDKVRQAVKVIDETSARIDRIVKGLRSFGREGSNDPFVLYQANKIVDEALSFCMERFRNRDVELRICLSDACLEIECRPVQISQVLLNLLNNALDATANSQERWVSLSVEYTKESVQIRVTDSGEGIPPNIRQRIFEPFFTTKGVDKGTGLGLSIAEGIVKAHRGKIYLDEKSKQTSFVVDLPRKVEGNTGG